MGLAPTKTALGTGQHGSACWDACGGSPFLRAESRGGLGGDGELVGLSERQLRSGWAGRGPAEAEPRIWARHGHCHK